MRPFRKHLSINLSCVINITLLIVLPSTKNPLFDVYCNSDHGTSYSDFFPCYESIFETLRTLCIEVSLAMRAYLGPFALPALIFVFFVFAKIFQIMRCSGFGHISYFFFHL